MITKPGSCRNGEQSVLTDPHQAGALCETDGFFAAGSVLPKISRESVGLLGGGRAILLQLAHPLVAAGVADYSGFQADPLGRLERTADLMLTIVLGDRHQAQEALRRFHAVHARIQGRLPHAVGPFPAGTIYAANDPALKLWVYATLVDTSLMIHERFVAPLAPAERDCFYSETRLLARLMGISEAIIPRTLEDFSRYRAAMLASDTLTVTDAARRLARDLFDPRVGIVPFACVRLLRFVTAGLLPERLREAYGLKWGLRQQAVLEGFSQTTRLFRPVTPAWLYLMPQAGGGGFVRWALGSGMRRPRR